MIWLLGGFIIGAGLLWALTPALTAPRARRVDGDGFRFWPPCPECGNIAVSCVGRIPPNSLPADAYTLACDHGDDFCGTVFTVSRGDIVRMQKKLGKDRRR